MAAVLSDFAPDSAHFRPHTMVTEAGKLMPGEPYLKSEPPPSPRPQAVEPAAASSPPLSGTEHDPSSVESDKPQPSVVKRPNSPTRKSSPNPGSYPRPPFTSQQSFSSYQARAERPPLSTTNTSYKASYLVGSSSATSNIPRSARSLDNISKCGENSSTIVVRDLAHIQSFANEEFISNRGQSSRRRAADDSTLKYEISEMPITDIIEMVAGLLTKITTTNDRQHESLHRFNDSEHQHSGTLSGLSSSVLAFHGKNVPSITIMSYLSRIHKYCPTTYEVFLSLLVYFDRMTERVNAAPVDSMTRVTVEQNGSRPSTSDSAKASDLAGSPPGSRSVPELKSELESAQYTHSPAPEPGLASYPLSHFFVVDSFNIHRLVIAGVTCASKFFSDVFYTNSRYAKVGGLPLPELNHLELQFLLLNDFRLSVPVEELEAYGTMLVEFYAREVIAQRQAASPSTVDSKESPSDPSSP